MKAILCKQPGGPDDLTLETIPDPQAGPGQAVVKVAAAGLNFFDTLIIAGKYQVKPHFPFSPAAEFAGLVESIGPGVSNVKIGDRVLGYQGYGCARERIAVKAEKLVMVPDNLDFDRAAGLSITYGTTIHALKDRGKLQAGETLAVLGAAGGDRPCGHRNRKIDGRARHRLRIVGREMRLRASSMARTTRSIMRRPI